MAKEKARDRVEVQVELIGTFFYDVSEADSYYRHNGKAIWIPEEQWKAGDCETGGDMADVERIVDDMIDAMLGGDCIDEACTDPMQPWVRVRLYKARYSKERIKAAIEAIVAHLVAGKPVRTEKEPYTVNRGSETYYDPERIVPQFRPTAEARAALLGRRVIKAKRMPKR